MINRSHLREAKGKSLNNVSKGIQQSARTGVTGTWPSTWWPSTTGKSQRSFLSYLCLNLVTARSFQRHARLHIPPVCSRFL